MKSYKISRLKRQIKQLKILLEKERHNLKILKSKQTKFNNFAVRNAQETVDTLARQLLNHQSQLTH